MRFAAPDLAQARAAAALEHDPRPDTLPLARTVLGALDIELVEVSAEGVIARMPAPATHGTSALLVLAETAASTAAGVAAGPARRAFGAELDAALLAPAAPGGPVVAAASALLVETTRHVWRIRAWDCRDAPVLDGRCTLGIVALEPGATSAPAR